MHTVIRSTRFQSKASNKFAEEVIDEAIERISLNPRQGKKFQAVNNLFTVDLGKTQNGRSEYEIVYYYENQKEPILVINLFKKNEKDILSKSISALVNEAL